MAKQQTTVNTQDPIEVRLLSRAETEKMLGVGRTALEGLVRRGYLRPIRFHRSLIRYRLTDVVRIASMANLERGQ